MTSLNNANLGQNKYCGPAVLSILTGKSSDECADVIRSINGQYKIEGVPLPDLLRALNKLKFDSIAVKTVEGASLYRTLIQLALNDGIYVIWVANHYVVVEVVDKKIYFCDNHTKEPIPAASSARLSQKVVSAYMVIKREEPKPRPVPKIENTDFYITFNSSSVYVDRITYYNDGTGDRQEIGRIKASSDEELKYILILLSTRLKEMK